VKKCRRIALQPNELDARLNHWHGANCHRCVALEGKTLNRSARFALPICALLLSVTVFAQAPVPPPAPALKEEMRQPWQRGDWNYQRRWLVAGPFACTLEADCLGTAGSEGALRPKEGQEQKRADGTSVKWSPVKSWADTTGFANLDGPRDGAMAFAFTTIPRSKAGRAVLSIGNQDGIRVWVNGKPVFARDGVRSLTLDENQVDVELVQGDNAVLVKLGATNAFSLRVLESGSVLARTAEIGPSFAGFTPDGFSLVTHFAKEQLAEPVKVEVIAAGGAVLYTNTAPRGELLSIDGKAWPDGPYDVRCSTRTAAGRASVTHLAWYKGDALAKARELAAEAAKADASKPEGFTLKMLAEMVDDRLGVKLAEAKNNPWPKIHSPLMEYSELMLERAGKVGRVRAGGFVRLAWIDEVDGSPQYARVYLPSTYDPSKKWPLVVDLHGYNPANPQYVRWWSVDNRHADESESGKQQGVIYLYPHGRGNVQYMGFADSDVLRGIAEAKRLLKVDDDRVYLTGNSMGGWGVWNVSTRHPEVFAAIAPVFGGSDYHSTMSEEELAGLTPVSRFLNEKRSSWSMADSLVNTPIYVHHGDQDEAVNVDWSRWGVRLLQRWGYDVQYREYPGRIHEALTADNGPMHIDWFLKHQRDPNPRKVRIRSAELRNAAAWWARVHQTANPLQFMVVDAEVVDRNVIRLDTDNVLDIVLNPGPALVDPAKPVKVVWNGEPRELAMKDGTLRLTRNDYKPAKLHKTPALPGSMTPEFFMTPYAVVIGTSSKDPEMVELCKAKAQGFIEAWKEWQKVTPRVFLDTEITEADMARYSLMLIGGPEANKVTAKLAAKLPLRVSANSIRIGGQEFPVKDAAVQVLYPNPLNSSRYVWLFAGTSTNGMFFAEPNPFRADDFDYLISDGRIPAFKVKATPLETNVVSGHFDYNWRYADALKVPGNVEIRAKGRQLGRPNKNLKIDANVLASYVGKFQLVGGPVIEVFTKDGALKCSANGRESDLVPESDTAFYSSVFNARLFFVKDADGKVSGFTAYSERDFEAKRIE
jgi:dienelactone hydrolase